MFPGRENTGVYKFGPAHSTTKKGVPTSEHRTGACSGHEHTCKHAINATPHNSTHGTMNWNDFRDWMDCGLLCTKQPKNICKSIIGQQVSSFSHVDITYLTCSCPYKRTGVRGPASTGTVCCPCMNVTDAAKHTRICGACEVIKVRPPTSESRSG